MSLYKIVSSKSHELLARLIDTGALPPTSPVTVSARSEENRLQVVITVAHYEPATISPETLAKIDSMTFVGPRLYEVKLTPQEEAVVQILDTKTPRKAAWIWAKLGKSKDGKAIQGGFKSMLSTLTRFGVLVHVDGKGYMRAA